MKHGLFLFAACSLAVSCAAYSSAKAAGQSAVDTRMAIKASVDDFKILAGAPWTGSLTYLNYGSDQKSTIPVGLSVEIENDETLIYAIKYPGEAQYNSRERMRISSDGRRIDGIMLVERVQDETGMLILATQGPGRDDNKAATIRTTYFVSANEFRIRKDVKFDGESGFFNRNEYGFTRQ